MCGILGWYKYKGGTFSELDQHNFAEGLDTMAHRGPDASEVSLVHSGLLLGHRRLSIIDLAETNNQPFYSRDRNYVLAFNGEIFNYIEIRDELLKAGYSFETAGDTEVVLYAYDMWGEDCVQRFNGMWAFALHDLKNEVLFCSRDRFGIKPFNYHLNEDEFSFSSESKAILKLYPGKFKPNYEVIVNFLKKSVGGQLPDTWFEGIKRLLPAHNMTFKNGVVNTYQYWQYPLQTNKDISAEDAEKRYKTLLQDAVKIRMRSDVEVGTTLSSGLDSTSIIATLRKFYQGSHRSYTAFSEKVDFEKSSSRRYNKEVDSDESVLVKKFVDKFNLKSTFVKTSHKNYLEELKQLVYYLEAAHHSQSIVPLNQLLVRAKKEVTVILEGQGADELLAGYVSGNALAYSLSQIRKLRVVRAIKNLTGFAKNYSLKQGVVMYFRNRDSRFFQRLFQKSSGYENLYKNELDQTKILKDSPLKVPAFDSSFSKYLFIQHTGKLVDLLHYGDRISMANSLESRLPFMDYRLVEFAFTLPDHLKYNNGLGKMIHRKAMSSMLPSYILNNPFKFGFNTPLAKIMRDEHVINLIKNGELVKRELVDKSTLDKICSEHVNQSKDHSRILFRLIGTEFWFNIFMK